MSEARHRTFCAAFGAQGSSLQPGWRRGQTEAGYGADFKRSLLEDAGEWRFYASGFGETLPHADNRVTLDTTVTDTWGLPAARIDMRWRDNELAMSRDMASSLAETFEAAGCTDIKTFRYMPSPGFCVHENCAVLAWQQDRQRRRIK